jgi:diguanylate cyclase (GGDEF)-like protein
VIGANTQFYPVKISLWCSIIEGENAMAQFKSEECLNFLAQVLAVLKSTNQHEQVFSIIVDRIVRMFRCQTCAIIIVDPATEYLRVESSHGLSLTFEKAFRRPLASDAVGKLLWTGKPVFIQNSTDDLQRAEEVKLEHSFGSCVCVQIAVDHRALGYLHVDARDAHAFADSDIRVLQSFADFAGVALNKSRLYEENLHLDTIDHETDLEKYAPFLEKLSAEIERAQASNKSVALLLMDIDNYKQVALTYGYETSKKLLKEWAGTLKAKLRCTDAAGRYGFDEIIIMRANSDLDTGRTFGEEIRKTIEQQEFTQRKIRTTVSVGVAALPQNAGTEKDLLMAAKEALYEAQHSGRNRVSAAKA